MTTETLRKLKEVGESGEWNSVLDQPLGAEIMLRSLYEQQDWGVMYSPIHHEMRMERVRELDIEEWVSQLRHD